MKKVPRRWRFLGTCLYLVATGCAAVLVRGQTPSGENDEVPKVPINSVLLQGDVVFAATNAGFYRATLSDKVWRKMPLLDPAARQGLFAGGRAPSSLVVYYHPGQSNYSAPWASDLPMMYVSKDSGQTWEVVSVGRNLGNVFVGADGSIYADEQMGTPPPPDRLDKEPVAGTIQPDERKPSFWHRVVVSRDFGKTWNDISAGLPLGYVYFILPSLDHPGLVRLSGTQVRHASEKSPGALYEADDANYHWKEVSLQAWRKDPVGREYIFCCSMGSTKVRADLSTLLAYPFPAGCDTLDRQAAQTEPEQSAYTFRQHEPMPVVVKTSFVLPHAPLQFVDYEDETVCWTLGGYAVDGGPLLAFPKVDPPSDDGSAGHRDYPGARIITLDDEHPYRRTVDLAKLAEFPAPGKYRVQPLKGYCRLAKQSDNSFVGQVIDVTITP